MHIKRVLRHTKRAVLACCERAITFVPEIIWRVTIDEVCTKLDFEQLVLSLLDWRPVTEESQLNA